MQSIFDHPFVVQTNEELKTVSENLRVTGLGGNYGSISVLFLSIPVKGNSKVIHRLEDMGWHKGLKRKRGGIFYQEMKLNVPGGVDK